MPHSYFAISEGASEQEYGFKQAVLKSGPPREYYADLGSAYVAGSLRVICAEIGTRLIHTLPKDCEAKGASLNLETLKTGSMAADPATSGARE